MRPDGEIIHWLIQLCGVLWIKGAGNSGRIWGFFGERKHSVTGDGRIGERERDERERE